MYVISGKYKQCKTGIPLYSVALYPIFVYSTVIVVPAQVGAGAA